MGKKSPKPSPKTPAEQKIHAAERGDAGTVRKLQEITEAEAVERRKSGGNVVVCGPGRVSNRRVAGRIEQAAHGKSKCCPPQAGPRSLPHWQPDPRVEGDDGHSFYETDNRKAN
jgi:hypothetical protein